MRMDSMTIKERVDLILFRYENDYPNHRIDPEIFAIDDSRAIEYLIEAAKIRYKGADSVSQRMRFLIYRTLKTLAKRFNDLRIHAFFIEQIGIEIESDMVNMISVAYGLPCGTYELDVIKKILAHENIQVRKVAIARLADYHTEEIRTLLENILSEEILRKETQELLTAAIHSLGRAGGTAAVPALLAHIDAYRYQVLEALTYAGDSSSIPLFIENFSNRDYDIKRISFIGVCRFADASHLPEIMKMFKKFSKMRRVICIRAETAGTSFNDSSQFITALMTIERISGRGIEFHAALQMITTESVFSLKECEFSYILKTWGSVEIPHGDKLEEKIRRLSSAYLVSKPWFSISTPDLKFDLTIFDKLAADISKLTGSEREHAQLGLASLIAVYMIDNHNAQLIDHQNGFLLRMLNIDGYEDSGYPLGWVYNSMHQPVDTEKKGEIRREISRITAVKGFVRPQPAPDWPSDRTMAHELAGGLGISSDSEKNINSLLERIFTDPLSAFESFFRHPSVLAEYQADETAWKYLLIRMQKALFVYHDESIPCDPSELRVIMRKFPIDALFFSISDFYAFVRYLRSAYYSTHCDIFEVIFGFAEKTAYFEKAHNSLQIETIQQLLSIHSRCSYYHDIDIFKKILFLVTTSTAVLLPYIRSYTFGADMGCIKAIDYIFNYTAGIKNDFEDFDFKRNLISWLDSSSGKNPKKSWLAARDSLEASNHAESMKNICSWITKNEKLKYENKPGWLDDVFNRFFKSAELYIAK